MTQTGDVVVFGAGIIGLSAAVSIARRSTNKVIVVDKAAGHGEGSTGSSSAVCRFRYSQDDMVRLARDGIAAYRNWSEYLGVADPYAEYHTLGGIWFAAGEELAGDDHRLQRLGVRAAFIDDDELADRFPAVNRARTGPDYTGFGEQEYFGGTRHLFEPDAGYVEPMDALTDLLNAARAHGVDVRFNTPVTGLVVQGGRVTGVYTAHGETLHCGTCIAAAGPWSAKLLAQLGSPLDWPLRPTRIQIVQINRPERMAGPLPICADMTSGIYFRPGQNGKHIVLGSILPSDEEDYIDDPDRFASYADDDFMRMKLHALEHRLPDLDYREAIHGYSGLYTINTADVHPVVGPTDIDGLYVATGFSGHGFKLAPAIGSMLAQLVTGTKAPLDTAVSHHTIRLDRSPIEMASKSVLA